jgi:ceramide glucosyltransferase
MTDEILFHNGTTMVRRLRLAPSEAMPWHRDRSIEPQDILAQKAKYDLLVMSDVRVEPDYLNVVAPFANPEVGVVAMLYKGQSAGNVASKLDALGMYMDSAAALVAKKVEGGMRFAFGWTMATSKKFLSEIGGWEAMVNYQ